MDKDSIVECDFDEITSNSVSVVALVSDLMDQSKLRLAMPSICFVKEVSELIDLDVDLVVVDLSKADVLKKLLTHHLKNSPVRWGLTGTIPKDFYL